MRAVTAGFVVSATLHLLLVALGWWLWRTPALDVTTPRPLPLTLAMFAEERPTAVVAAPPPAHEPAPAPSRKPPPVPRREPVVEAQPTPAVTPEEVATEPTPAVAAEAVVPPHVAETRVAEMEEEYRSALRNLIEAGKVYPLKARRLHHQGMVLLSFTIEPDGTIRDVEMRSSSGSTLLDEAALTLIRGVSGRLPAPAGLAQRARSFTIPLAYHLK
ncbi:MAG TPA: energy transducer TonB [Gammaproteobacteria bacterium]